MPALSQGNMFSEYKRFQRKSDAKLKEMQVSLVDQGMQNSGAHAQYVNKLL